MCTPHWQRDELNRWFVKTKVRSNWIYSHHRLLTSICRIRMETISWTGMKPGTLCVLGSQRRGVVKWLSLMYPLPLLLPQGFLQSALRFARLLMLIYSVNYIHCVILLYNYVTFILHKFQVFKHIPAILPPQLRILSIPHHTRLRWASYTHIHNLHTHVL